MTLAPPTRRVPSGLLLAFCFGLAAACSNQQSPASPSPQPPSLSSQAACTFAIADAGKPYDVAAGGAVFTIAVTASRADCAWTAVTASTFLTTNRDGATGNASVDVLAAPNAGEARTGQLQLAGHTVVVNQRAADAPAVCGATVAPTSLTMPAEGGTAHIAVTGAGKFCAWTASTDSAFLRVTSTVPHVGDGTVTLAVEANEGRERTGSLIVAGTLVTLTQAASSVCVSSVRVTPVDVPAAGGTASVDVTADPGCQWQLASSEPFVTVAGSGTGSGNGLVTATVAANTGTSVRTARLSAGGRSATISQAAAASTPGPTPPPTGPTPAPPAPPPPPVPQPLPSPGPGTENVFSFTSDPGAWVGAGASGSSRPRMRASKCGPKTTEGMSTAP